MALSQIINNSLNINVYAAVRNGVLAHTTVKHTFRKFISDKGEFKQHVKTCLELGHSREH